MKKKKKKNHRSVRIGRSVLLSFAHNETTLPFREQIRKLELIGGTGHGSVAANRGQSEDVQSAEKSAEVSDTQAATSKYQISHLSLMSL